jgi:hypothetical protein
MQVIKMEYSANGVPMIKLGETYGTLTFSKITSNPDKGYKYLCFRNSFDDTLLIKRNGKRRMVEIPATHSYVINMNLERAKTKAVSLPLKAMPSRLKEYLKKNIKLFLDDQGYFSFRSIRKLQRKIEGAEIEKILKTVQRKRKKRKLHPPK